MAWKDYYNKQKGRLVKWGKKRYMKKNNKLNVAQVAKDVWYLKGLVNSEKKYLDVAQLSATVDYSGNIYNIGNMSQGDTEQTRSGNSIFVRSVSIRGSVRLRDSGADNSNLVRMMVIIDKNADVAAAPAVTDILEDAGGTNGPISHLKFPEARNRYKILKSRLFSVNRQNRPEQQFDIYLNLRHHIKFTGTTSANLGKGQIYLVFISDTVTAADLPTINFTSRTMYHDN